MPRKKKEVVLEAKEHPTFRCEECGYEDYMGNVFVCPICDPEKSEEEDYCYFVDFERGLCRQDGKPCQFIEDRNWEECPKLEGLGRKQ